MGELKALEIFGSAAFGLMLLWFLMKILKMIFDFIKAKSNGNGKHGSNGQASGSEIKELERGLVKVVEQGQAMHRDVLAVANAQTALLTKIAGIMERQGDMLENTRNEIREARSTLTKLDTGLTLAMDRQLTVEKLENVLRNRER